MSSGTMADKHLSLTLLLKGQHLETPRLNYMFGGCYNLNVKVFISCLKK